MAPWDAAFQQALAARQRGEVPIGAVIVAADGRIIAQRGNETRALHDPTAHAEILAIRDAGAALGSQRLTGCSLYVTLEPCPMCAAAISFARIERLYFSAFDAKGGGVDNGVRFFADPSCHHAPECYGGIRESESTALLKAFFAQKR